VGGTREKLWKKIDPHHHLSRWEGQEKNLKKVRVQNHHLFRWGNKRKLLKKKSIQNHNVSRWEGQEKNFDKKLWFFFTLFNEIRDEKKKFNFFFCNSTVTAFFNWTYPPTAGNCRKLKEYLRKRSPYTQNRGGGRVQEAVFEVVRKLPTQSQKMTQLPVTTALQSSVKKVD